MFCGDNTLNFSADLVKSFIRTALAPVHTTRAAIGVSYVVFKKIRRISISSKFSWKISDIKIFCDAYKKI